MLLPLELNDNKALLEKYGLAVALNNSTEYLMQELTIFLGGFNTADQATVNVIFEGMTFGKKLNLAKRFIQNRQLVSDLTRINQDRNLLAHGVNMQQADKQVLKHKNDFHPLTDEVLNQIIERARKALEALLAELTAGLKNKGISLGVPQQPPQ